MSLNFSLEKFTMEVEIKIPHSTPVGWDLKELPGADIAAKNLTIGVKMTVRYVLAGEDPVVAARDHMLPWLERYDDFLGAETRFIAREPIMAAASLKGYRFNDLWNKILT